MMTETVYDEYHHHENHQKHHYERHEIIRALFKQRWWWCHSTRESLSKLNRDSCRYCCCCCCWLGSGIKGPWWWSEKGIGQFIKYRHELVEANTTKGDRDSPVA